jgi:hypothetical protein
MRVKEDLLGRRKGKENEEGGEGLRKSNRRGGYDESYIHVIMKLFTM